MYTSRFVSTYRRSPDFYQVVGFWQKGGGQSLWTSVTWTMKKLYFADTLLRGSFDEFRNSKALVKMFSCSDNLAI